MNAADTLFVLVCAAMVLVMTPALSAFYTGLTRRKSGVDIMMQVWICLAVVGILWVVCGFSLAFGSDTAGGLFGGGDFLMLKNVGAEPNAAYGPTVPFIAYFFLQVTYAIITPALICGAVAERMTLKSYLLFVLLWSVIVYIPLAHMVWGGGLFSKFGMIDWAGGLVIHTSAGFSALAAALILKKRKNEDYTPHNMAQVSINCGLLLFGWLAFNAGGALAVNSNAVYSMVNSLIGSMMGMAVWTILTAIREKRPSFMSAMLGFLGGLVAVTPAAGIITPSSALILSLIVSIVCYVCINIIHPTVGFDDTLDVWGLHGMGGFTGTILLPLFADSSLIDMSRSAIAQVGVQAGCVIGGAVFAFVATWIILKVIGMITPLRLPAEIEGNVDEAVYKEKMYDQLTD